MTFQKVYDLDNRTDFMKFSQIVNKLKTNQIGGLKDYYLANDPEIECGASLELANSRQVTFLEKDNHLKRKLSESNAAAILLPHQQEFLNIIGKEDIAWAVFDNPKLAFTEVLEFLSPAIIYPEETHPSAVIDNDVILGTGVFIGPNVYIGKRCHIGNNCIIHAGVVLYDHVNIGNYTELHSNCVIHSGSRLGNNCIINSNAVIGSEGFGFIPTNEGWKKMPQKGITILEDNVEIGSGSTVDRPAVGETLIGAGTKIDNLVQIGHGVKIGKGCAMASQVGIAGGAQIGNGVILAGQVGVANRVHVGDRVIASSKCGIHADIAPGEVISGFPAIPNRLWLRCSANFRRLPDIAKSLRKLNRE